MATTTPIDRIFISYRRQDSRHMAGRLYDRLSEHSGSENVFMDVDSINPGLNFEDAIQTAIEACNFMLVVIGPQWLSISSDTNERRIDDPHDPVAVELAAAIEKRLTIIPILVDGASVPTPDQLPTSLTSLAGKQGVRIDHETFQSDVAILIDAIAGARSGSSSHSAVDASIRRTTQRLPFGAARPQTRSRKFKISLTVGAGLLTLLLLAVLLDRPLGAEPFAQSRSTSVDGATVAQSTVGSLNLEQNTRYYHPENGTLPNLPPPNYDHNSSSDFCPVWSDWAKTIRASSTSQVMTLTTIAGATSPITILDLRAVVHRKSSAVNGSVLDCENGAGGYAGTTAYIDLDHTDKPTEMDIGADANQHTTLPGGRYVVDPKNAESLFIYLKGSPGMTYEFSITMKVVENSKEESRAFGSSAEPYRLTLIPPDKNGPYYQWNYTTSMWVDVTGKQNYRDGAPR